MSDVYDDSTYITLHPVDFSPWMTSCLSVTGYNNLQVPFKAVLGDAISPSYSYAQDTRSGNYSAGPGINGMASYGFPTARFYNQDSGCMDLIDRSGRVATLSTLGLTASRTLSFPDRSGTLLASTPYTHYTAGSTTTLLDTTGLYGSVKLYDKQGGYVEVVVGDSATPTLLNPTSYSYTTSVASGQVGINLSGNLLQIIVGAAIDRDVRMVVL